MVRIEYKRNEFVGDKVKRQILKRRLQKNKAHQFSRKTNISTPWFLYPVRIRI